MAGGRIVVTRSLPGVVPDRLAAMGYDVPAPPEGPMPRAEFLARLPGAVGIVCTLADRVDGSALSAAGPSLRVVSNYAVGVDNVDLAEAARRGVRVCNTPGVLTDATADMGFSLLLAAARRLPEAEGFLRAGRWTGWDPWGFLGVPVAGATIGIVGMGQIGGAIAARARGFGMRVLYHNRRRVAGETERALGASWRELDALLSESDFVVVAVPLSPETRGLIGDARISLLRPHAVLVNIARGEVVDEAALAAALREGRIFGAGLDVYEGEPRVRSELLEAPRAVLSPHLGSATRDTRERMGRTAVFNLLAVLEGREPPHAVT